MIGHASVLSLPCRTESIATARTFVRSHLPAAVDVELAGDIVLVASELVSNAIEHGSGDDVEIRIDADADGVDLIVTSTSQQLPRLSGLPSAVDALRGRGLHIVAALSGAVSIDAADDVVSVICHFDVGD